MRVVLARRTQVDAIRRCVVAAYGRYLERLDRPPAPLSDDYEDLVRRRVVHVALDEGDLLGLIVMWPEPDHYYVDNIAVHPDAQMGGVGSMLLRAAEIAARAAGRRELRLYTNEQMHENLSYYARHGFIETHRGEHEGHRRVFLSRSLD